MTATGAPLRVGVNLLWMVPGVVGGSEEYTVRLLHGLADLAPPDLEVELFGLESLPTAHPGLVERFPTRTVALRGRAKALRVVAESTWLASAVRRRRLDVVHHPGGVAPLLLGRAAPVVTIHDLQPLEHPEGFGRVKVAYLRAMLPRSARVARAVVTPSATVAAHVAERLGVEDRRLHVVAHGLDAAAFERVDGDEVEAVRRRLGVARRWILYPVITYPHKNHRVLIRAFAALAATHGDVDLVLAGGAGPAEGQVAAAIADSGVAARVHRPGRLPRPDLDALLTGADVVAFPSRYEGFGVGALEAMARGVPVVAADATALPEVVGEAGVLVDPDDVDGWASALADLLDDGDERTRRARAGRARAALFTNEVAAKALTTAYRAAAGRGTA